MNSWYEFYKNRLNAKYYHHVCSKYARFIIEVNEAIKDNDLVIESGCGMGNITKALWFKGKRAKYCGFDNHIDMIELCKQNLGNVAHIIIDDIFKADYSGANVIHSHGVLEHFSDDQIRHIIFSQLNSGAKLIHYVPSYKYIEPSFGDERLLTPDEWDSICKPNEIIEFNDGYDLILKWDGK